MIPLKRIISYYAPHIKRYKWSFLLTLAGYGAGFVGTSVVTPLFYREIIDAISSAGDRLAVADTVIALVVIIALVMLLYNIVFRIADYAMAYAQSNTLRELYNYAFQKLESHSYQFFINTFQGSLVAKVRRYVNASETLHDNVVFSFWQTSIQLLGIFTVLFIVATPIAIFFALWCLIYLLITIVFVQKKRKYDLATAAADSRVTGSLADAITNVLNIKMFASRQREINSFAAVTHDEEVKRRKAWYFNNLIMLTQGTLWLMLEVGGLYLIITLWLKEVVS